MKNARDEQGFVLVAAIAVMTVMTGLGFGLLLYARAQTQTAGREQAGETAFNLAEAALNAQVGQVSRLWPGEKGREYYPSSGCTATTSIAANGCPDPAAIAAGYPNTGAATCPAGTPTEAWGSPLTNKWTTYVRDDAAGSPYFNSAVEQKQPAWDANRDGKVWVRSVGVVQCHLVTLLTLVSQQFIPANFPHDAATGNWFGTSNNGNKIIVKTKGEHAQQPGAVSMRCAGFIGTEEEVQAQCKKYDNGHEKEHTDQISPDTTNAPASPSPTLSATQLKALEEQARWAGTYWPTGSCPPSLPAASGFPTYVEGPCSLSYTTGVANSAASPGFLILNQGTLELNGNAEFYGVIYALNPTNSPKAVVTVHGTANVYGAIVVDGNGGIDFGSSAANLIYEPTAISLIKTYAGATPTRNSFRVLPVNQ
jgi:Tfp pilus assembly protein PilX